MAELPNYFISLKSPHKRMLAIIASVLPRTTLKTMGPSFSLLSSPTISSARAIVFTTDENYGYRSIPLLVLDPISFVFKETNQKSDQENKREKDVLCYESDE